MSTKCPQDTDGKESHWVPGPRTHFPHRKLECEPGEVQQALSVDGWMRNQLAPGLDWETGELMGNCRQNALGPSIWTRSMCPAVVTLLQECPCSFSSVGAAGCWRSREGQIRGSVLAPTLTSTFCLLWLKPQQSASAVEQVAGAWLSPRCLQSLVLRPSMVFHSASLPSLLLPGPPQLSLAPCALSA